MAKFKKEIFGSVKSGELNPTFIKSFTELIKEFPDCRIKVIISKVYKERSSSQNRFFHGPVIACVQDAVLSEWGEHISLEQAKEMVKEYCHYKEVLNEKTGEYIKITLPTSELSTIEFEELIIKVRKWLWDSFNYVLPEPNENFKLEL